MNTDRMTTGLALLARVGGASAPAIVDALAAIAPDLATFTIGFAYGEVCARPDLDPQQRQLATVAALAALGGLEPQLDFHVAGALNVGCTPVQIVELMIHLVIYAGFPAALNGITVARKVFERRGLSHVATETAPVADRRAAGTAGLRRIDGVVGERVVDSLRDIAPDLGRFIVEFAFGEIYPRHGLDLPARELVTVAALAALGNAAPQLRVHMHGFLNVGGSVEQLVGIVTHIAVYAGFPRAIDAALAAKAVVAERAATGHGA